MLPMREVCDGAVVDNSVGLLWRWWLLMTGEGETEACGVD